MNERIEITDIGDPRIDAYMRLTSGRTRSKTERDKGFFIAEAQTVIEVALEEGCVPLSVLYDESILNERTKRVIGLCEERNPALKAFFASKEVLKEMTGFELTRGLLAEMRRPPEKSAEEICANAGRVAVLEDIADSVNVGAIMRCAAGIGIDAVLLTKRCCDPLLRRSIRVSMGTVFKVSWAYVEDAQSACALLRGLGFRTVAMALVKEALPVDDARFSAEEKLAVFLGTEGDGLSKETIASCDDSAIIPMRNGVDSLNVAAAAAVAFWATKRK